MGTNVLNGYRSFNYNFTLAALKRSQVNSPGTFDPNNPTLVIATTKGKSRQAISTPVSSAKVKSTQAQEGDVTANGNSIPNASNQFASNNTSNASAIEKQNRQAPGQYTADQVSEFNKSSAGRYDMFIDNVDIRSLFKFDDNKTVSTPFEMHFDIFEPYSMNGFIEALQISALAAGYTDYISCPYVLVIDFIGYPDNGSTPDPEIIPSSTRIFRIKIAGLEVSVTSEGTVYKVTAIPYEDKAFSEPIANTKIKVSAEGTTVGEILTDIINKLNKQVQDDAISVGLDGKLTDSFEILFPEYDLHSGKVIGNANKISKAYFEKPGITSANVPMDDIDEMVNGNGYGSKPISNKIPVKNSTQSTALQKHTVQFDSGIPLPQIISAVIRDSSYMGDVVKAFHANGDPKKVVDENQMIDYFIIIPQILDKPGPINAETNSPYRQYMYVVQPYKLIYNTAVPGLGRQILDDKNLKKNCLRNYNYFYTGLNTDIIDFKINFNTLFFEELPRALGNSKELPSSSSAGPNNSTDTKKNQVTPILGGNSNEATPPQHSTANATGNNPGNNINASPTGAESWRQVVKVMHDGINNSVGLIMGDLSILGDPYYLTAGGSGNYAIKNNKFGSETGIGEAARSAGQVLISLDFKNPIDINEATGYMQFDNNVIPYSGVYRINEVRSEFKGGMFKQTLSILRQPGQPQTSNQTPSACNEQFSAKPKAGAQVLADTAPESKPSAASTNDGSPSSTNKTIDLNLVGMIKNPDLSSNYRASINGLNLQSNLGLASSVNAASSLLNAPANALAAYSVNANYGLASALTPKALTNAAEVGSNALSSVGAKVNGALNGVSAIDKAFNVETNKLSGLSGVLTSKISNSLPNLYSIVPNIQSVSNQMNVGNLTKDQMQNLPALNPTYSFNNVSWINGNPVTKSSALSSSPNSLGNLTQLPQVDQTANAGTLNSGLGLLPTNTAPSREGVQLAINNNLGVNSSPIDYSVVSNYGSKTDNNLSPLLSAINK